MSLKPIVRRLGGDLYDGGRRANVPAPGHSAADRSVSLWLREGRLIVHTFGDGDWRAVLDHLRALNLIDGRNGVRSLAVEAPPTSSPSGARRIAVAQALWAEGRALTGTLSARHVRGRGVTGVLPGPDVARHRAETPVSVFQPGSRHRPALLVAIRDAAGAFSAVEVTYLDARGGRARDLRLPRKTVGQMPPGSAVRIDPVASEMLVAEGVFTALSARDRFGLPSWALLSTRNLRAWTPPDGVRAVLIAADRGRDGEASAQQLAATLRRRAIRVRLVLPPEPWGDFNESAGAGGAAR